MRSNLHSLAVAAVAAFLLHGPSPVGAQEGAGGTLTVPFDPPLDMPLRFRMIRSVNEAGRHSEVVSEQSVVFSEISDGHIVTVTTLAVEEADKRYDRASRSAIPATKDAILELAVPRAFQLNAKTIAVQVANWEEYLAATARWTQEVVDAQPATTRDAMTGHLREILAPLSLANARTAMNYIGQDWPPLFGYGNREVTAGQLDSFHYAYPVYGGSAEVTINQTVRFEALPDGHIALHKTMEPEQASLDAAYREYRARLARRLDENEPTEQEASETPLRQVVEQEVRIRPDGLPDHYTSVTRQERAGLTVRSHSIQIQLVDAANPAGP